MSGLSIILSCAIIRQIISWSVEWIAFVLTVSTASFWFKRLMQNVEVEYGCRINIIHKRLTTPVRFMGWFDSCSFTLMLAASWLELNASQLDTGCFTCEFGYFMYRWPLGTARILIDLASCWEPFRYHLGTASPCAYHWHSAEVLNSNAHSCICV